MNHERSIQDAMYDIRERIADLLDNASPLTRTTRRKLAEADHSVAEALAAFSHPITHVRLVKPPKDL